MLQRPLSSGFKLPHMIASEDANLMSGTMAIAVPIWSLTMRTPHDLQYLCPKPKTAKRPKICRAF
eukprot:574501-Amphidinium_carterae.1